MNAHYDHLCRAVILRLLGDAVMIVDPDMIEHHAQRIAIAVHKVLGMTPEHWATLTEPEREPWLERLLCELPVHPDDLPDCPEDLQPSDCPTKLQPYLDRKFTRAELAYIVHREEGTIKPEHTDEWGTPDEPGSGRRPKRWTLRRVLSVLMQQFPGNTRPPKPD